MNVPGDAVFQPSGEGSDDDIFQILLDLKTALLDNASEEMKVIQERVDSAFKRVASKNASLGGSISRLENLNLRLDEDGVLTEERRSKLEDADIAEEMMKYNQAELVYQAALAATARVIQYSLVNFLK